MKNSIAFLLTILCLLCFAACNGNSDVPNDSDTGNTNITDKSDTEMIESQSSDDSDTEDLSVNENVFRANVAIRTDDILILYTDEPFGLYILNLSSLELVDCEESDVKAGIEVSIEYSGLTLETYPARLGAPETLRISGGETDNICEMYVDITESMWTQDPGLNGEICALELNDDTLSDGQKRAIAYELGKRIGPDTSVILSTREELEAEGLIDKEDLYFENGALVTITADNETRTDDGFEFSAQKWASGTGAIFWFKSSASCKNGIWTYEFGGFAIS